MKKTITTAFLFGITFLFAQPEIKFDETIYDYGEKVEGTNREGIFYFTNTGTEPLIINRAQTSGGPLIARFSKDPVLPGKTGSITFIYDTHQIGRIAKTIMVYSNAKSSPQTLHVKGEIVRRKTTIEIDNAEKDIGRLNFGDVDTVQFTIKNTGNEKLYIRFNDYHYPESDLLRVTIQSKDSIGKEYKEKYKYDAYYYPDETVLVTLLIKNIYGNTGAFERNLIFNYNSHDTIQVKIKGQFIGIPNKPIIYEGQNVFFYTKGKLSKKQEFPQFSNNDSVFQEDFFEGSYCVLSRRYHWRKNEVTAEYFYKNGVLTDEKKYDVKDY
ncbi:MAG: DUF1573 domain-containing protein [Flavobacteriaceae bacterium]|jgi:hypothetical protein|nr:DUF1573 domain-containing protein [Flavobacteriaceae bacterium]